MQKDLVEASDGGYYEVHISQEGTCHIPGIGKCLVSKRRKTGEYCDPFAYRIERVIDARTKTAN